MSNDSNVVFIWPVWFQTFKTSNEVPQSCVELTVHPPELREGKVVPGAGEEHAQEGIPPPREKPPVIPHSVCTHIIPLPLDRGLQDSVHRDKTWQGAVRHQCVSGKLSQVISISLTATDMLSPCFQRCPSSTGTTQGTSQPGHQPWPWLPGPPEPPTAAWPQAAAFLHAIRPMLSCWEPLLMPCDEVQKPERCTYISALLGLKIREPELKHHF